MSKTVEYYLSKGCDNLSVYLDDCNCVSWDINPDIDSNVIWNNKVDLCSDSCYIDSIPVLN